MLTVAARPSPKAAIASVAYMRENAKRRCQEVCITAMLTRKLSYNVDVYTKILLFRVAGLGGVLNYHKTFGFICQTPLG
ncbi:MAG: hypothetical protein ACTHOB_18465 [Ginsengibacter sp.]